MAKFRVLAICYVGHTLYKPGQVVDLDEVSGRGVLGENGELNGVLALLDGEKPVKMPKRPKPKKPPVAGVTKKQLDAIKAEALEEAKAEVHAGMADAVDAMRAEVEKQVREQIEAEQDAAAADAKGDAEDADAKATADAT